MRGTWPQLLVVIILQVPQYLFEQAVECGVGGHTNIIICQPRRIAAVGLATRVADEVGDDAGVGGLVGYSVRLDTKSSSYTRLLFCTTGVLLRRLMSDPKLEGRHMTGEKHRHTTLVCYAHLFSRLQWH